MSNHKEVRDQGFEVKPGGVGVRVPLGAAFTPGARVPYPLGTVVNTPFFQVPTPTFGHKSDH